MSAQLDGLEKSSTAFFAAMSVPRDACRITQIYRPALQATNPAARHLSVPRRQSAPIDTAEASGACCVPFAPAAPVSTACPRHHLAATAAQRDALIEQVEQLRRGLDQQGLLHLRAADVFEQQDGDGAYVGAGKSAQDVSKVRRAA